MSETQAVDFVRLIRAKNAGDLTAEAELMRLARESAARGEIDMAMVPWWVNSPDAPAESFERGLCVAGLHAPCEVFPLLEHVTADHFLVRRWAAVFEALRTVWRANQCRPGQRVPTPLLAGELRRAGTFNAVGQMDCIRDLSDDCIETTQAVVETYAAAVVGASRKRGLMQFARDLRDAAGDGKKSADEVEGMALTRIRELTATAGRRAMRSQREVVERLLAKVQLAREGKSVPGVTTGLMTLDAILGGLHKKELLLVAARPAMGKTASVENMAYHVACENPRETVLFFSQEMPDDEVVNRRVAGLAGVDARAAMNGRLSEDDHSAYEKAAQVAAMAPIQWDDATSTIEEIAAKARAARHLYGALSLIVIDYAQLLRKSRPGMDDKDHASHVGTAAKHLAKELEVPVILLSQLNRECETRQNKRPLMADLRDSGVLEQTADSIVMLYREWVYDKSKDEHAAEMIVVKNRHGAPDTAHVRFDGPRFQFSSPFDEIVSDAHYGTAKERDAAFYAAVARHSQGSNETDERFTDRESGERYVA